MQRQVEDIRKDIIEEAKNHQAVAYALDSIGWIDPDNVVDGYDEMIGLMNDKMHSLLSELAEAMAEKC